MRARSSFLMIALFCGTVVAQQEAVSKQTVIAVVGASGTPEYGTQFAAWTHLWEQACTKSSAEFISVGLDANTPTSDLARVQQVLTGQSGETTAALWLVLIGHGTFDGRTAKFNLRGPDLSANDLAQWLKPLRRPVIVIDAASSSAPFLKELSSPGRIIITATKSGFEQNYARFGQYLVEAVVDSRADLDKDGQTSLLETFLAASHAVGDFYAAAGRLATEHAILDDNGDALGTPAELFRGIHPAPQGQDTAKPGRAGPSLDGYRANQLCLLYSPIEAGMPPELRAKRDQLELQVMELREARARLSEDEYFSRLEPLLREIAGIYEQADSSANRR